MNPDLSPLQAAARRVEAAKSSEQEIAALRARVEALEGRQSAPAGAAPLPGAGPVPPAAAAEMTKEEKWAELNRQIEATTDNAEIWRLSGELDKLRWSRD